MTIDTWTVIATGRRRGLSEATIARQIGLRDGATGYGMTRNDYGDNRPVVVVPDRPRVPVAAKYATAFCAMAPTTAKGAATATPAPSDIIIQAKCQGAPAAMIPTPMPTITDLLSIMSDISGQSVKDLKSPRRARHLARPRQVVMWLARKHTPMSLPSIGAAIGRRDHTTVMHGARRVDELIAEGDAFVRQWVADAEKVLAFKFPHACGV